MLAFEIDTNIDIARSPCRLKVSDTIDIDFGYASLLLRTSGLFPAARAQDDQLNETSQH